jgi:hypothetical protein
MTRLDKLMVDVYVRMVNDGTATLEDLRGRLKDEVYEAVKDKVE